MPCQFGMSCHVLRDFLHPWASSCLLLCWLLDAASMTTTMLPLQLPEAEASYVIAADGINDYKVGIDVLYLCWH